MPAELTILACTKCKRRNYTLFRTKRKAEGRMEVKKFCPADKQRTPHKEVK